MPLVVGLFPGVLPSLSMTYFKHCPLRGDDWRWGEPEDHRGGRPPVAGEGRLMRSDALQEP